MRGMLRLALVVLVALGVIGVVHGETAIERLVSPGPLSAAHAGLENNCKACHRSFDRHAQPAQCLSCHRGIARDRATGTRFHGLTEAARQSDCRQCHREHRGLTPPLVPQDFRHFDHDHQSAYALTGGHRRTRCAACHVGMTRFRETPQACASCHARQDVHRGGLGPQCQACHTTARWRDVLPFDHDRTRYPLTGAHRTTPCLDCHRGEVWHGVTTQCVGCHLRQDVHHGADGRDCASCHGTARWRTIRFDHDRMTHFPLHGAHATTACIGCHALTARPAAAPVTCNGCHVRDDVHRGADGPKCESCHGETTWKVAKFDHNRTAFALTGLHTRVTCVACHPKSVDTVKVGTRCIDCHLKDDVHKATLGTVCERCHKTTGFRIAGLPRISTPWRSTMLPEKGDFPRSGLKD